MLESRQGHRHIRESTVNTNTQNATLEAGDAIVQFLASPPKGTPAEVIAAFAPFSTSASPSVAPHLFLKTVEQAPVAVSITSSDAEILYVNSAFEELTGYERKDVLGKNESILSNKNTPKDVYEDLWLTINRRNTWTGQLVNRRKDNSAYLAELTIAPVLNADGDITHFLGMHRDVTEFHRLQQELNHQKDLVETVIDAAPIVVALIDGKKKLLLDNHEYKKLVSDLKTPDPSSLLLHALEEQADLPFDTMLEVAQNFQNVEIRLDFAGQGSVRWFSCSGVWVNQDNDSACTFFEKSTKAPKNLLLLANDVTQQRREFERARLKHLSATLAEQQRVCGMREALAAAVFQIQQPMNLVNAAVAMLNRTPTGGENLLPVLEQIAQSAHQALDSLKAALPAESYEPRRSTNLNEIVQQVLDLSTESLLAEGIVVEWRPATVLPNLNGQPKQLRGMLKNLLDNAVNALSETRMTDKVIRIVTAERHHMIVVEIQDNGPGIPREQRLRVFEPLYSGWKHRHGHAGMGLAIAQEIANQHGGTIEIDANVITGCLLRLSLPASE